jgi:myo-inositol 2-dehydrogenase/D-chiro-inositol 1-dehydrogenase
VFAVGTAVVDPVFAEFGDIDTSIVTLRFAGGGLAVIDNSRRAGFGYDVRTEVFGSNGALFVGYARDTPLLHLTKDGVKSDHVHWFLERFDQAYVEELRDFVDCLVEDRPTRITGEDGRAAMALAYAAEASLKEQRPVSLDRFAQVKVA